MSETTAQQNVPLVLVVDDDKAVRLLLRRVLEPGGYAVEEAEDGVQALSAYERLQPDLVLLDIMMPGIDGFATCARLRALPGGDRTPVLMITALDDKEAVDRAFEAGATDYITKPPHLDVLRHRVARLLRARQAEEALRASEAHLRDIFEAAQNISFITTGLLGTEARILEFSPGAERIFGYSREEVIGKPVAMLHLPEDMARFPEIIESMCQRQAGFAGETTLVRKSGEQFPALFTTHPIFDAEGDITATLGVSIDITKRKRAEEALRESEGRLKTILDSMRTGMVIIDAQTHVIVDANPVAIEMIGAPKEQIVGSVCHKYICSAEKGRCPITDLGQKVDNSERVLLKANGKSVPILKTVVSVMLDGREHLLDSFVDITERKRLEEQVQRQDRMAALGQLAGGVAHDFNNILMGITLSAQMLLDQRNLPRDLAPDLEDILADAQRAGRLVEQILDFSRRSYFETRPVDLNRFIQESVDMLRRTLPEDIRILLEVGRGRCVVNADPTRMQQMLVNLATNARDAMPGGGELRIGLSRVEAVPGEEPPWLGQRPSPNGQRPSPNGQRPSPNGQRPSPNWVCLAVSDTGSGMPPEVVSRLFEPFFTTKPVGQGTGMGLAQAHGIVEQHGGHIGVETEMGRGTTFRVYLPAHDGPAEAEEAPQAEEVLAAPERQRETILLVEDEDRVRKLCRRALELLGYRVLTAVDGRNALEVYRSAESVDLVLTDMVMPEMGGRELMWELRKMDPRVKGVVITGYALADDLEELREEGILDVVHKPLDVGTLERVVRWALNGE